MNNVVLFSIMKTDPTSVNNVVLFLVMETDYSTPLITVYSETSIQQNFLPTAVNNVVLVFSYGYISHFSEQYVTFFSYGDRSINPFNYCRSLVLFYAIHSIYLIYLCSSEDKDE